MFNVAVVGATGAVGREMVKILEQRKFPVKNLRLFASERSKGTKLKFCGDDIEVEVLAKESNVKGIDISLFSAGAAISGEFAPMFAKNNCIVVDNSSRWRMEKDIPLIVPEVNPEDIQMKENRGIIANPNCSTIQLVVALKPIYDKFGIERVQVATYQSVSGAGQKGIAELIEQAKFEVTGTSTSKQPKIFPKQIFFNLVPRIGRVLENLYTEEEMKMINETKKIMHDENLRVSATCVRVPVIRSHSEAVFLETKEKATVEDIRNLFNTKKGKGITLLDDPTNDVYPVPIEVQDTDDVFVGRIRKDTSSERGILMWIVADNIRKGAALNAVQIAELLIK